MNALEKFVKQIFDGDDEKALSTYSENLADIGLALCARFSTYSLESPTMHGECFENRVKDLDLIGSMHVFEKSPSAVCAFLKSFYSSIGQNMLVCDNRDYKRLEEMFPELVPALYNLIRKEGGDGRRASERPYRMQA